MSLLDRTKSIIITTGTLGTGSLKAVDESPVITPEGWDFLTVHYAQRRITCTDADLAALFPQGTKLSGRNFWQVGVKPRHLAPGFWGFEATYKGWVAAKPDVVRVGSSAAQQSAEQVSVSSVLYAKVETHENMPDVSVSYLVADVAVSGKTDQVGTTQPLPSGVAVAVADSVWTSLPYFTFHYPNGWVLMSSDQERLPGTSAAWVTDTYRYVRDKTPG